MEWRDSMMNKNIAFALLFLFSILNNSLGIVEEEPRLIEEDIITSPIKEVYDKQIKIYGNTEYKQDRSKSLVTTLNFDFKLYLYSPSHEKYAIYGGGVVSPEYDHFGKELRTNVFTVLGVDF